METENKKRRPKGPSSRGNFEDSKQAAQIFHDDRHDADRKKSERLRAMRLARDGIAKDTAAD